MSESISNGFSLTGIATRLTLRAPITIPLFLPRRTLSQFHGEDIFATSLFHGVAIFLLQFSISMALGVIFGLASSLMLKHSQLHLYPGIESCIITLLAFTSYFMSTGMHMSGECSYLLTLYMR